MKQLGRVLGNVLAVVITVFSLQAQAETQIAGRDFNHMATGFPLTGGHATAACETCHVAGVFKGTAKDCDGCHALGRRVVATPKSTSHIVTDAPCETCHFNTSTFMGARFNHGTAIPGQCSTCHNGRLSAGRPANHNSGNKAIKSCDQCHRSYAWLPSSWNHIGVAPGTCRTCHVSSPEVSAENRLPAAHSTPITYTSVARSDIRFECDDCHNFIRWVPAAFRHNTAAACDTCHTMKPGHIATAVGATCGNCHRTRSNGWLPASMHTGNEAGQCRTCHATTPQPSSHTAIEFSSVSCDACHRSQTTWAGASGHLDLVPPHVPTCRSCHGGREHDGDHGANASMDCSVNGGCHRPGGSKGRLFSKWD
jgi:hypothetical protein